MSSTWSFSPSSEPYLERFIAAAPPPDPENKWFQKFGDKSLSDTIKAEENTIIDDVIDSPQEKNTTISYEDFFDRILNESTISAEYILQECYKNPELIPKTAIRLPPKIVEQLFDHIFSKDDTDIPSKFIITFIVSYVKVQYSRLCIELLANIKDRFSTLFTELLGILINDADISSTVLCDFISGFNEDTSTDFMKNILTTEVIQEGFTHNVQAICTLYKNCAKDDAIQNYIQKLITLHGKNCTTDKSFGRLLLMFLQVERATGRHVSDTIERCVHEHRSLFKHSCMLLLEDNK